MFIYSFTSYMFLMIVTFLSFILYFIHSQDKTFQNIFYKSWKLNEKKAFFIHLIYVVH